MGIIFKTISNLNYETVTSLFFEVGFLKHKHKFETYQFAIEKAFKNSQYIISAYIDDELVGFARVVSDKLLYSSVWNLIVKSKFQKQGIGSSLLQKCLDAFPNSYYFLIADEELIKYYQKKGFELHNNAMFLKSGKRKCVIYN